MTGVVVVGGGVIGSSIAWRAATEGRAVTVVDDPARPAASWAAAGMLAPVTEAEAGQQALTALHLASARAWPAFAADLAIASGHDPGMRPDGTLVLAFDDDDAGELDRVAELHRRLGIESQLLSARECRRREPLATPRVRSGLFAAEDHQVDNRALLTALRAACARVGVVWREGRVSVIDAHAGQVRLCGGETVHGSHVVIAAGWASSLIDGVDAQAVRPVKGQILRLRARPHDAVVSRCVRGIAQGTAVYIVPRRSGEVVVGATMEELGDDTRVTAGAVADLLRAAVQLVPSIAELELVETAAGLRPSTPDNAPIIGNGPTPGLVLATGHHRNGILLAPITADAVVASLCGRDVPAEAAPFTWQRFG